MAVATAVRGALHGLLAAVESDPLGADVARRRGSITHTITATRKTNTTPITAGRFTFHRSPVPPDPVVSYCVTPR